MHRSWNGSSETWYVCLHNTSVLIGLPRVASFIQNKGRTSLQREEPMHTLFKFLRRCILTNLLNGFAFPAQSMMIMRLGVIKPLETRKFIAVSRQYLGSANEAEVINLWKDVLVGTQSFF